MRDMKQCEPLTEIELKKLAPYGIENTMIKWIPTKLTIPDYLHHLSLPIYECTLSDFLLFQDKIKEKGFRGICATNIQLSCTMGVVAPLSSNDVIWESAIAKLGKI